MMLNDDTYHETCIVPYFGDIPSSNPRLLDKLCTRSMLSFSHGGKLNRILTWTMNGKMTVDVIGSANCRYRSMASCSFGRGVTLLSWLDPSRSVLVAIAISRSL